MAALQAQRLRPFPRFPTFSVWPRRKSFLTARASLSPRLDNLGTTGVQLDLISVRIHFEILRQAVQAVQSGVITAFGLRRRQVNDAGPDAGPFCARSSTPFFVSCPSFCLFVVNQLRLTYLCFYL